MKMEVKLLCARSFLRVTAIGLKSAFEIGGGFKKINIESKTTIEGTVYFSNTWLVRPVGDVSSGSD